MGQGEQWGGMQIDGAGGAVGGGADRWGRGSSGGADRWGRGSSGVGGR